MLASLLPRVAHRGRNVLLALLAALALAACQRTVTLGDLDGSMGDAPDAVTADGACDGDRCAPPDARVPCSSATDCRACGGLNGCGWCGATGQCVDGNQEGATNGTCASAAWVWDPASCPATDCNARDCADCMRQYGCGWCGASGRCVPGTADGAFGGMCEGGPWAWLLAHCPNGCTAGPGDCIGCQTRSGCGWCEETESCVPANADGTAPATGTCAPASWTPSFGVCAPEPETCASFNDCGQCSGGMGGAMGCGWCRTRGPGGRCVMRTEGNCPEDAWVDACATGGM